MSETKPDQLVHTESGCACGSDHDHGPTGAEVVKHLATGYAVLSLLIPLVSLLILISAGFLAPSDPTVLIFGIGLGLVQLLILLLMGIAAKNLSSLPTYSPAFLIARVALEEVARLAIVLTALLLYPTENKTALGLSLGAGAMLVWTLVTTWQNIKSRNQILKPLEWSKTTVLTVVNSGISVRQAMSLRFLDILALLLFSVSATALVATAPVMIIACMSLSVAAGLSTLIIGKMPAERRQRTLWVFAPIIISIIVTALVVFLAILPAT